MIDKATMKKTILDKLKELGPGSPEVYILCFTKTIHRQYSRAYSRILPGLFL